MRTWRPAPRAMDGVDGVSGAGRRQAGRAHLQSIHIADITRFCLRPSGSQQQSRLSVGRLPQRLGPPHQASLGLANLSRVGARGWQGGSMGLGMWPAVPCRDSLPGVAQVWRLQNSAVQDSLPAGSSEGGLALGFRMPKMSMTDPRKPGAAWSQHPETGEQPEGKAKQG